jgi:hypothetical protein
MGSGPLVSVEEGVVLRNVEEIRCGLGRNRGMKVFTTESCLRHGDRRLQSTDTAWQTHYSASRLKARP